MVTGIGYRNPDLLADMARTVDHISGGRLVLGLGAGWYEKAYTTYGYEFGTWKSRFDLFDAGLKRIEARMGQLNPPPVRKIPVLIGGSGPKRTLPAVARHADIWHTVLAAEAFTEASAQVDELAAAIGRDGNDIERSVHWFGAESADTYRQAGKGIDQMILQNEAWMHLMDMETGEVGLEECASFVLFNRNGTHKCIIIPFVRLGDGTVNWRPRQSIDDSFDGEVPDAMKEAMS